MPSKRFKKALEVVDAKKAYALKEAVGVLAKFPKAKFNETIDLAFRLGIDPKQSDQMVRGTVWSDCLGSIPRRNARSIVSLNLALGNFARTPTASFNAYAFLASTTSRAFLNRLLGILLGAVHTSFWLSRVFCFID